MTKDIRCRCRRCSDAKPPGLSCECSIVVFGAGALGLGAVMAAKALGCNPIIAVDIKASRLELAGEVGATHALDPDGLDAVDTIRSITKGGADYVVEATGQSSVVRRALECLAMGGECVLATGAPLDAAVSFDVNALLLGRSVHGALLGNADPETFIPRLVGLHQRAQFPLHLLVTTYPLAEINQAADDLLSGAAVKPILLMP